MKNLNNINSEKILNIHAKNLGLDRKISFFKSTTFYSLFVMSLFLVITFILIQFGLVDLK